YTIASWLGVGYSTLLGNMNWGMGLLAKKHADALDKVKPPQIRRMILGQECKEHLVVVDRFWTGRAIDTKVDDLILLPSGVIVEANVVKRIDMGGSRFLVRAVAPGVGRAVVPDSAWAQYIRVSRKQFSGLARFRHLEEVEDE